MSTEETRRESYELILPEVDQRKKMILKILKKGPMTAHAITEQLWNRGLIPYYDRNFVSPRLTELRDMDVIEVVGKKFENRTNRKVTVWKIKEKEVEQ